MLTKMKFNTRLNMSDRIRAGALITMMAAVLSACFLGACAFVPPFNQYSFNETARLKAESLALLREARQSSTLHERDAEAVLDGIKSAYQDANLRQQNQESMRQWAILLDPDQPSLAGGIKLWKTNDTLSTATIAEFRKLVASNFDEISKLEGKKRK